MPSLVEARIWKIRREGAFPSQFYGETYDGVHFYGRYRNGCFTLGIGETEEEAISNGVSSPVIEHDDGTGDGVMTISEFLSRAIVNA